MPDLCQKVSVAAPLRRIGPWLRFIHGVFSIILNLGNNSYTVPQLTTIMFLHCGWPVMVLFSFSCQGRGAEPLLVNSADLPVYIKQADTRWLQVAQELNLKSERK